MKKKIDVLKESMAAGTREGMATFDQAIFTLFKEGRISYENAMAYADSGNDLRLKIKLDDIDSKAEGEEGAEGEPKEEAESDTLRLKT